MQRLQREFKAPQESASLDGRSPFLKAHMLDGTVYVLSEWRVDEAAKRVSGQGDWLDTNREVLKSGTFAVELEAVALLETNVVSQSPSVAALAVITGASVATTIFCIASPKTCFGSCPTFYVSDGKSSVLQAEGFSASVTRALEATDLDALYRARPTSRELQVRMTNEALETHVVRSIHVLAARRPPGGRVVAMQDATLWQASALTQPRRCVAAEGDCAQAVRELDGIERFSTSDPEDLAVRESIDLEFSEIPSGNLGLVIGSRQTFLSTFLFYQGLAALGTSAAASLAALERQDRTALTNLSGMGAALGGIEVSVLGSGGAWIPAGALHETGPIATDVKVVPLPDPGGDSMHVRLRLTRGHWRLDFVSLVQLTEKVEPVLLEPSEVSCGAILDEKALRSLRTGREPLVTLPGDEYTLRFRLPENFEDYELFLQSRGYYLEWMRQEWLVEEDPALAALMLVAPRTALRVLAPEFKKLEPTIETLFWSSRYVRN